MEEAANKPPAGIQTPDRSRGLIIIIALSFLGLVFSAELLRIHLTIETDPTRRFACTINEAVDCAAVARSREAYFLAVPVPAWTLLTYAGILFGCVLGVLVRRAPFKHAADYVLMVAAWSLAYSFYLAFVSAFRLHTFCLYCAALYLVNLGLFAASVWSAQPFSDFARRRSADVSWFLARPAVFVPASILFLASSTAVAVNYYRSCRPEMLPSATGVKIDVSRDPSFGYYKAPVTIIEFSDFECPACRKMHTVLAALLKKYEGKVRLIHKNYPLNSGCNPEVPSQMHPHACTAAYAAECALKMGAIDRYWDPLWTAPDLTEPYLVMLADQAGMDPDAFRACLHGDLSKEAVLEDVETGNRIKIEATPTFIINGEQFSGSCNLDQCSEMVEKALKGEPAVPPERLDDSVRP